MVNRLKLLISITLALCTSQPGWAMQNPPLPAREPQSQLSDIDKILYLGISQNDIALCRRAIQKGANVNARAYSSQETPLHYAIESGFPRICKLLLTAGADLTICNNNFHTPLTLAIARNHINCVSALLTTPLRSEYKKIRAAKCGLIALRHAQPILCRDMRLFNDQMLINSFAQDHMNRIKEMLASPQGSVAQPLAISMEHKEIAQLLDPANLEASILKDIKRQIRHLLIPKPKATKATETKDSK